MDIEILISKYLGFSVTGKLLIKIKSWDCQLGRTTKRFFKQIMALCLSALHCVYLHIEQIFVYLKKMWANTSQPVVGPRLFEVLFVVHFLPEWMVYQRTRTGRC